MTNNELNTQLLKVCLADKVDYARAEELLRQGAEPLGKVEHDGHADNLYTAVIRKLFHNDDIPEEICKITELFLRCGMDISRPAVPYDDDQVLHPLSTFIPPSWSSFTSHPENNSEYVLRTLKLLLDHGLCAEDAYACWGEVAYDLHRIFDLSDPDESEWILDAVRKLMLIASYPHILQADEDLRREIRYDSNHYDLTRFRRWDDFSFCVDSSCCERISIAKRPVVTIIEKSSGEKVWTFGVFQQPEDL